eukprot:TRINITY_DN74890_c0_g1_i1.p1 TRINITY_DN74890_c0_g1~~TRINITY_DN74890_c0_g1_i1.p1  ORF type:complete len:375 (-),score=99.60 TRINITY_DN74890_c0_g1_i1:62-1186(-)
MAGDGAQQQPPPLEELLSCKDFRSAAHRCLAAGALDYIEGGEADTQAANEAAFAALALRPRVLRDVSSPQVACELFGTPSATPFYLSSVAKGRLVVRREGEAAFVRAAAAAKTTYLVPSVASLPLAEIYAAAAAQQRLPFQFYLLTDEAESFKQLKEALALGCSSIVVTVDANAPRAGSFRSATGAATGVFPSPLLTWARLKEIRKLIPADMPVYLKGIQTAEDALEAVRFGVRGIVVSNHGGRCCGGAWSALDALEDVAGALRNAGVRLAGFGAASAGDFELYFDSGVRSGRDALKALCLGARGVGLGRPYYWAAACHGEPGVTSLLELLTAELCHAMAQVGAASLRDLGPELLCRLAPRPQALPAAASGASE